MEPDPTADGVEALERRAREAIAAGQAGDAVQLALDQLVADRSNGERLETAARLLRDALGQPQSTDRESTERQEQ